jgi:hypothetical protein
MFINLLIKLYISCGVLASKCFDLQPPQQLHIEEATKILFGSGFAASLQMSVLSDTRGMILSAIRVVKSEKNVENVKPKFNPILRLRKSVANKRKARKECKKHSKISPPSNRFSYRVKPFLWIFLPFDLGE